MVPVFIATKDNRITGLLREIEDALREETSSLALSRAEVSLRSLAGLASCLGHCAEQTTREIERARNNRPKRRRRLP